MATINNLKKIREIYGATQDDISKVLGVNRSTVSLFETGAKIAGFTMLEKLSIYYEVGPENFYEKELNEVSTALILNSSKREKAVKVASEERRNKAEEFAYLIANTSFSQARSEFMFSMKILLATADYGDLDELKVACMITEKMKRRLNAIIDIREEEEREKQENDQETLFDLLDKYSE